MAAIAELVKAVDAHALRHYDDGWDVWVECVEKDEKRWILSGCTTEKSAVLKAAATVKELCKFNAIYAENCALYDTGEDYKTEFYNQIQRNADKTVAELAED